MSHNRRLLLLVLLLISACTPDYQEIPSGKVHSFSVLLDCPAGSSVESMCFFSVPPEYTPKKAWPLLVVLHGYGSGGARFHAIWHEAAAESGFILAAPQGEAPTEEGVGWGWGNHGREVVKKSMDHLQEVVHIDRRRVSIAGFSQGGKLATMLALEYPYVFEGMALLGTNFAASGMPDFGEVDRKPAESVYIGRGEHEGNPHSARRAAEALRSLGCTVLEVTYPGVGHGLPQDGQSEIDRIVAFLRGES